MSKNLLLFNDASAFTGINGNDNENDVVEIDDDFAKCIGWMN